MGPLDEYLRTHTSEDNARFRQLALRDKQRRDDRHTRLFGTGKGRSHGRSGFLLDPPVSDHSVRSGSRMIVRRNTRFPAQQQEQVNDDDEMDSVASTPVVVSSGGGYDMLRDGFRLAAPSPREAIAMRLGKRPTLASVVVRKGEMSPAAHRLMQRLNKKK
ncbi:hypothetical protein IWW38_000755 [Coemansia aciculifera]|uniref:Uncharacterized protein n=1 Tax=Coemansia aciculifera TaxID=417176 RepID=A0ACC1M8W0_9FUNG|nr:hypothetical protein IWW38_000755 [Coemansia aciculifera]